MQVHYKGRILRLEVSARNGSYYASIYANRDIRKLVNSIKIYIKYLHNKLIASHFNVLND